jgi:hypothetical protein
MNHHAQLGAVHATLAAFWIRFERELNSRWEKLEHEAAMRVIGSPSGSEKHSLLEGFF